MSRRRVYALAAILAALLAAILGFLLLLVNAPLATANCAGSAGPAVSVAGLPAGPVAGYRGVQLGNAAAVLAAGQAVGVDVKGQVIGVMTAMGESDLTVLDHGDVAGPDSRGLFQQRANGAWGSYADRMNPYTSATNFFRALVTVPGWESLPPTLAAHRAQSNADPYFYTPYWQPAQQVVAALSGTTVTGIGADSSSPACTAAALSATAAGTAAAVIIQADLWTHPPDGPLPYSWGGGTLDGPSEGFAQGTGIVGMDCSALTRFAYYHGAGLTLPRTAADQYTATAGRTVAMAVGGQLDLTRLQPGDLIFYGPSAGEIHHVALYASNGQMIEEPHTGAAARQVPIYGGDAYAATRPLAGAPPAAA